jgi:RNA polymerase sigma-70 factor, ECF subfamily
MPTPLPDADLIAFCLAGNTQAFRPLVERYQGPLYGFLRARLATHEPIEEIAQETFVRAFTQLRGLQKRESFLPWLLGIADRVLRESRRSSARRTLALTRFAEDNHLRLQTAPPDKTPAESDPGLTRAVAALPEPYRQVILLRYHGGLSCNDISRQLGMPLGTVTKVLSRAYALLREALAATTPASPGEKQKERTLSHEL